MLKKTIISFLLINFNMIFPQQPTNWKFYTDMKNINDLISVPHGFWSATAGGAFYFNGEKDSFTVLSRSDGLLGVNLSSLCRDNKDKIWFGGNEGTIDVYDPSANSVKNILDILNSDKTLKQINSLASSGDTIFAATDFGISLINSDNYTFYDTFTKLGTLPSNLGVNSVSKFDLIYACTDQGIAVQKRGALNLSLPESWDVFQNAQGLPSNRVFKVVKYGNLILASTDAGIAVFNGNTWSAFSPELNSSIPDIKVSGDSLFILSGEKIYLYSAGGLIEIYSTAYEMFSIEYSPDMGILASTANGVLRTAENNFIFPNGPQANKFFSLSVDNESSLWVASGTDPQGVGFFNYNGESWTNYNISNTPLLPTNSYFVAYSAPDNTKYFGNWGQGFARLRNNRIDIFNSANTDIIGQDVAPQYIVISGFAIDSRNNLWVLNSYAGSRKPLSMMTPDSTWYHFSIPAGQNAYLRAQHHLAIDPYDTKWYCSQDGLRQGLFYFNENKTYDNTSDDKSGFLNTANSNLTDNFITAVAVDLRGDIWVGTGFGVNIISNQQSILTSAPNLNVQVVFSMRQQSINCIAVDPLNRKWIGTNQGLQVVNSDGSQLIASYTTENTLLPTNQIKSLAIDRKTGRIYVGTTLGLISFDTPSIEPAETYSDLQLYPNPFVLNKGTQLKIKNLIKESEIKVLTLTGRLVKYLEAETESSPGGDIAFWDGTDAEGNYVSSGIYFIVAFDKEGNNIVTGKVAVIKE